MNFFEIKRLLKENEETNNIKKLITPTKEWMAEKYTQLNKDVFRGQLGDCILDTFSTGKGSNGNTLGWFSLSAQNVKAERSSRRIFILKSFGEKLYVNKNNFVELCKPTIRLNAHYKGTEDAWLNTLVHEMCHYYTYMYGYAPVQAHGREFRSIAEDVYYSSNGRFTIQRLATAEEMTNFELDDETKAKNDLRQQNRINKMGCAVIVLKDNTVRLLNYTNPSLLSNVMNVHLSRDNALYGGYCDDNNLVNYIVSNGYQKVFRTYRYWDITSKSNIIDTLLKYNWHKFMGISQSLAEALNKEEGEVLSAQNINNKEPETNTYLGYTIIKDGNGYNLLDYKKRKTFGSPVTEITFNKNENVFMFKLGKHAFKGVPGKWQKIDNMEENRKIIYNIVKEAIDEVMKSSTETDNDSIEISNEINLGIESLFETNNKKYE